jgi:hypothetical protein
MFAFFLYVVLSSFQRYRMCVAGTLVLRSISSLNRVLLLSLRALFKLELLKDSSGSNIQYLTISCTQLTSIAAETHLSELFRGSTF